ncbi:hypothetical protein ABBQ38_011042 [Trebouxia sp. C0009 RCD-2024]
MSGSHWELKQVPSNHLLLQSIACKCDNHCPPATSCNQRPALSQLPTISTSMLVSGDPGSRQIYNNVQVKDISQCLGKTAKPGLAASKPTVNLWALNLL